LQSVLVTGGAGYIGSVLVERLVEEGYRVVVLDNLKRGHRAAIAPEATFVKADLGDRGVLDEIFRRYRIEAVMHLAADTSVEHSMSEPGAFLHNNVVCGMTLLDCMLRHGVNKLIFSSSAAVYGEPEEVPVSENAPARPINAYGESKLIFERILFWYGQAYGLKSVSLRYFNAAGASERFGEDHNPETQLVPNVLKVALGQKDRLHVFGADYNTRDGTCIRDYIHVMDIAKAHILVLKHLDDGEVSKVYNLGNDTGYSVLEVVEAARKVTGASIPIAIQPRRRGDPAMLVASSVLARQELGWQPDYPDIEAIVESAWRWQKEHPHGYGDSGRSG